MADHDTSVEPMEQPADAAPGVARWQGSCECGFHCAYPLRSAVEEAVAEHIELATQ